jgi:hypothetical protein
VKDCISFQIGFPEGLAMMHNMYKILHQAPLQKSQQLRFTIAGIDNVKYLYHHEFLSECRRVLCNRLRLNTGETLYFLNKLTIILPYLSVKI